MEAARDIEAKPVVRGLTQVHDGPVEPAGQPPLVDATGEAFDESLLCRDVYLELFWLGWFRWA